MKKIIFYLLFLLSLILPSSNSYADQITINNYNIFTYPVFDFTGGDFFAGSGISNVDKKRLIPLGTIVVWFEDELPEGWLECNGSPVNPTKYPDLYKMMKFTPNFQGMFLRGVGSQSFKQNNGSTIGITNTIHSSGGFRQIQGDATRRITGWFSIDNQSPFSGGSFYNTTMTGNDYNASGWEPVVRMNLDTARTSPTSNENRPVNIAVKYIIKAE